MQVFVCRYQRTSEDTDSDIILHDAYDDNNNDGILMKCLILEARLMRVGIGQL